MKLSSIVTALATAGAAAALAPAQAQPQQNAEQELQASITYKCNEAFNQNNKSAFAIGTPVYFNPRSPNEPNQPVASPTPKFGAIVMQDTVLDCGGSVNGIYPLAAIVTINTSGVYADGRPPKFTPTAVNFDRKSPWEVVMSADPRVQQDKTFALSRLIAQTRPN